MNVNFEKEETSLNITSINLLVRFNETWEIFPIVTQVLIIFPTTAATSASAERVNSGQCVTGSMYDSGSQLYREVSSPQQELQLMCKYLWSG